MTIYCGVCAWLSLLLRSRRQLKPKWSNTLRLPNGVFVKRFNGRPLDARVPLAVTIFVVVGASDSVINIVGNITFLVGPTIMVFVAFKLAKWRIELMAKNKKEGAEGAKKAEGTSL